MHALTQCKPAESELGRIPRLNRERSFQPPQLIGRRAEYNLQIECAGGHFKLLLVVEWLRLKSLHFLLVVKHKLDAVAEARADCSIRKVRYAHHIRNRLEFAFFFGELNGSGGDIESDVHPRGVG